MAQAWCFVRIVERSDTHSGTGVDSCICCIMGMSVPSDTIRTPRTSRRDTSGELMGTRAFISYDYDNDARLKDLLVGQARHSDSPFEIVDWSIKSATADWKVQARRRIKASGLVIVLCGKNMSSATGVNVELAIAKEEAVPYFLLAGYQHGSGRPTSAGYSDKLYTWTWDNLKALVGGSR